MQVIRQLQEKLVAVLLLSRYRILHLHHKRVAHFILVHQHLPLFYRALKLLYNDIKAVKIEQALARQVCPKNNLLRFVWFEVLKLVRGLADP